MISCFMSYLLFYCFNAYSKILVLPGKKIYAGMEMSKGNKSLRFPEIFVKKR